MDTITAIVETLSLMAGAAWHLKFWIGAIVAVMAVLWYYAPVLDYTPATVREDDRS